MAEKIVTADTDSISSENRALRANLADAVYRIDTACSHFLRIQELLIAAESKIIDHNQRAERSPELRNAAGLIELGKHLAGEWGNEFDLFRETMQQWLDKPERIAALEKLVRLELGGRIGAEDSGPKLAYSRDEQ